MHGILLDIFNYYVSYIINFAMKSHNCYSSAAQVYGCLKGLRIDEHSMSPIEFTN